MSRNNDTFILPILVSRIHISSQSIHYYARWLQLRGTRLRPPAPPCQDDQDQTNRHHWQNGSDYRESLVIHGSKMLEFVDEIQWGGYETDRTNRTHMTTPRPTSSPDYSPKVIKFWLICPDLRDPDPCHLPQALDE